MKREKDLKQLFEEYLNYCSYPQKLSKETIRGYKESFRNFCVLMPNVTKPGQLTVEVMERFFQCLGTRKRKVSKNIEKVGVKASTIGTYWSKLHTYFEWLLIRGYIQTNPLNPKTGVKPPRVEYNDKKALTKTEIHKLISAVMLQYKNMLLCKRDVAMIHLLYFCGLRRGELIGLRVFDVDMD